MPEQVFGVTELTRHIKRLLEGDRVLQAVSVRGEISNFKHHTPSGHMYFTLKDDQSLIRCVMFRAQNERLAFRPGNGLEVVAHGWVGVYERDGAYQLYVSAMETQGSGALYEAFEKLKEKLQAEGLFDVQRKRPLPFFPRRVAIVTSRTGAAIQDIVTVSRRRFPGARLVLVPVLVQGDDAPGDICRGLAIVNRMDGIDLIIVGRGGGSLEELWAFNTERVARAIASSRLPVISAVGHEKDVTIADLVADARAATPSAAAVMAFPDRTELLDRVMGLENRLQVAVRRRHREVVTRLERIRSHRVFRRPADRVYQFRQRVDQVTRTLALSALRVFEARKARRDTLAGRLDALSPLAVLARGYSICRHLPSGRVVRGIKQVRIGQRVGVLLRDGELSCLVRDKKGGPA